MRKFIEFKRDKENDLKERLYLCESEYLNYSLNLEGLKDASRNNEIQLLSSMVGNFSIFELFLGTTSELHEYLQEERTEDTENGNISN